jgi:hypothetical protein
MTSVHSEDIGNTFGRNGFSISHNVDGTTDCYSKLSLTKKSENLQFSDFDGRDIIANWHAASYHALADSRRRPVSGIRVRRAAGATVQAGRRRQADDE